MTSVPTAILSSAEILLPQARTQTPLVQCLTNTVTTNLVANAILAIGGSPAMVDIPGEAGPFASIASAVLINLGTPSTEQRQAIVEATRAAADAGTPWVLDPVGVGALPIRTALAQDIITLKPAVIRGNASEIRALAGFGHGARGVDSTDTVDDAQTAATTVARTYNTVVAVSGPVDLITDGTRHLRIANGSEFFTRITGAGCALGGVIAALSALVDDTFEAAATACLAYAVAGELAAQHSHGPGTFAAHFLDALGNLTPAHLAERAHLS
ncbi:MAG: hydroxyethylthiazole kinase [Actinomycetaceae bacterium]|nr:hydroxyethylthiazole kinase [Actinomycetaceae bacterium]